MKVTQKNHRVVIQKHHRVAAFKRWIMMMRILTITSSMMPNMKTSMKGSYATDYYGVANYYEIFAPTTYETAIKCEDSSKRERAMDTWDLVKLPVGAKVIDNKWV